MFTHSHMWNTKSTFDSKSNPSSEKNCIVILQIFFYIWKKRHKNVYFSRGFLEAANVDSFQFELALFCDGGIWSVHVVCLHSRTGPLCDLGPSEEENLRPDFAFLILRSARKTSPSSCEPRPSDLRRKDCSVPCDRTGSDKNQALVPIPNHLYLLWPDVPLPYVTMM